MLPPDVSNLLLITSAVVFIIWSIRLSLLVMRCYDLRAAARHSQVGYYGLPVGSLLREACVGRSLPRHDGCLRSRRKLVACLSFVHVYHAKVQSPLSSSCGCRASHPGVGGQWYRLVSPRSEHAHAKTPASVPSCRFSPAAETHEACGVGHGSVKKWHYGADRRRR